MKRSREPEDEPASGSASNRTGLDPPVLVDAALPRAKIAELDASAEPPQAGLAMACLLHKEKLVFATYQDYEAHYNKVHVNRCFECKSNFPSPHLLGVHIEDCHDPLVALKRDRGEHTVSSRHIRAHASFYRVAPHASSTPASSKTATANALRPTRDAATSSTSTCTRGTFSSP